MRLIYLSPVPWASFAQRPHKFVDWFHKRTGGEVLWVDPYPTRFPQLSDFRRVGKTTAQTTHDQPSWLQNAKACALPLEPFPCSGWLNALMWRAVLAQVDAFVSGHPALVVVGKPSVLALAILKRIKGCRSVYDAMDDFPAFYGGLSRLAMRKREEDVVRRTSTILVSSRVLRQRWVGFHPDVRLVHNGLDLSMLPAPKTSFGNRETKILGYVGTIAAWFDWGWVINMAKVRPMDKVRLIGPVFHSSPAPLPDNVELLPPCSHMEALKAMQDFDVGLIPFKKNNLTASVDPIKYYEYRALGLPVISTDFGEMGYRGSEVGTFICKRPEDIQTAAVAALIFRDDPGSVREFAMGNSWEARFDGAGIALC